ncbi:MAG: sigma-70 family RNA polymerase sigma factor [Saprospiraceae bacterium]|nr:sigma-70 family RNA polymerase sigma factor [Saprospiraceae bacterium]
MKAITMPRQELDLEKVLLGCRKGDRNSQRSLYEHFYGYAMSICLRYSGSRDEAVEVLNDAFLKVFAGLDKYDPTFPFRTWLRRILINAAIDYYRKHHKTLVFLELKAAEHLADEEAPLPVIDPDEDMLPILRELSPSYRLVFNLYVMEEYKHHEIAELLGISVSTSRSNLVRAIENLRALLMKKSPYHIKPN